MNLKLFKKIIKNLLKFVHITLGLIIRPLLWLERRVLKLRMQLDAEKPAKPLFYRNSAHEFIKDVGYIHREE